MLIIWSLVGLILFALGYKKEREDKNDFSKVYKQVSENEEMKLVNHTISEEELKQKMDLLEKEINDLKKSLVKPRVNQGKQYRQVTEKLKELDDSKSIEELSKEMEIGKGELLLLKNLSEK